MHAPSPTMFQKRPESQPRKYLRSGETEILFFKASAQVDYPKEMGKEEDTDFRYLFSGVDPMTLI